MVLNRQWLLAARPVGMVEDTDFRMAEVPLKSLQQGEFRVRVIYLSLAPVMRHYMLQEVAGIPPVAIGGVMRGRGVGEIVESAHPDWPVGEIVHGPLGWQEYAVLDGNHPGLTFRVGQRVAPVSTALGALGITGFTAYFGLLELCLPRAGETVVVSGATGGVGSCVGQLARLHGCRTVAITGGEAKAALATSRLGYDAAIDYRSEDVASGLDRLCPDGIDVYFDNVGGATLDAVLGRVRRYARIALCGQISEYLPSSPAPTFSHLAYFTHQRSRMQGFFIFDYAARFADAEAAMSRWIGEGKIVYQEDVLEGLEAMPRALRRLYQSANLGKQVARVSADPAGWPR